MVSPESIRKAIIAAPFELDNTGETPHPGTLYIPLAHRKALTREAVLVVGARGVGKSFWTAALSNQLLRRQIGASVQELSNTIVRAGYATKPSIDTYPDLEALKSLIASGHEPYVIWRAVVLRWVAEIASTKVPTGSWSDTVLWVEQNSEPFAKIVERANEILSSQKQFGLIVFDALDRTSNDWDTMNGIVRDLLRVSLWLRDFSHLRAKIFLRPDQMERTVTAFVDASKILATRADLTWERHDLHAMMWQRLINASSPHGDLLRSIISDVVPSSVSLTEKGSVWFLPHELLSEMPFQRALFEVLAGEKMGKDARRGVPYVWSVSHLADGHGKTSPRSFLAAIDSAAEDSLERYGDYPLALHYESIKRGIQRASEIRVLQVAEDDPWVPEAMRPLKGMNVPSDYEAIVNAWKSEFPEGPSNISSERLPPQHAESWDGVRKDLERLGIFVTRKDGRIDMPDLYRVGFNLGRKGGVAPRS
ncbi:cobalamin ABC transporter ATPase [Shinella sp. SUS2]|uniref:hypothetical protein n=1 Tax=unclassified Shinella TaxID=2643062 RepID=UPI000683511A|nr:MULTISPECIES: hypothetical protein [unclassified Shinella]KNY14727.1 cobalamin ABC transporter ATPase [Shinella sp. SUS2]KOC74382.1 cobalamin ABC transporter ATPase [Shinella sp. GWS1]